MQKKCFIVRDWLFSRLVCQKVIQQRYGFSTGTLSSTRSLTPQTPISNVNIHSPTSTLSHQQSSPISNQVRLISSSHSVPSSSYVAGNINLAQTAPASVFSSYHLPHDQQQQQQPILVPPHQILSTGPLVPSSNGVLKDRHNQQGSSQLEKRTRSFKEPLGVKLSTLSEAQAMPLHEGQVSLQRLRSALTRHDASRLEQRTINTCFDPDTKA